MVNPKKWKLLRDKYVIVSIPTKESKNLQIEKFQKEFLSIIYEKDEITLIIKGKNYDKIKKSFKKAEVERNFRIITYDEILDWNITGFISKIAEVLAKNKIVMGVISAYSKDHFLIKDKDIKKALKILKELKK
jgi:hypothetical protein